MLNADGSPNAKKTTEVSSNVVSVLQAGAFFGALGSAPISNWIGRRWTLVIFMLIFSLGAASILYRGHRRFITYMHTDIDHSGWGRPWLRLHIWWSCYIGS